MALRTHPVLVVLGRVVSGVIPEPDYRIRLRAFLTLNDIELDLIVLFQRFVSIQMNRRVMDEYIGPIIAADESVALGVVEPLDLPFVLSHRILPSLRPDDLTAGS
jgi:hypothetical protein